MFTLNKIISILDQKKKPLKELKYILERYDGKGIDKFKEFDDNKYKKNLIYRNENYEIFLICWKKNQFSGIHNHSDNGCLYKVLEGQLSEFLYDSCTLNLKESSNLNNETLGYIDDGIGYHKVGNESKEKAMSIHIYSPPHFIPINFN